MEQFENDGTDQNGAYQYGTYMGHQEQQKVKDPLSTYKLPFKTKEKTKSDGSSNVNKDETKPRKVHTLELIFSLKL